MLLHLKLVLFILHQNYKQTYVKNVKIVQKTHRWSTMIILKKSMGFKWLFFMDMFLPKSQESVLCQSLVLFIRHEHLNMLKLANCSFINKFRPDKLGPLHSQWLCDCSALMLCHQGVSGAPSDFINVYTQNNEAGENNFWYGCTSY